MHHKPTSVGAPSPDGRHPSPGLALLWLAWAAPVLTAARQAPADDSARTALPAPTHAVYRATGTIEVDAVLDEDSWAGAEVIPLPYEWYPGDNAPPPVETDCRVTYDARRLYLGCRAFDPSPDEIRAHFADRDDTDRISRDDYISITLDPFDDQRRGFLFRANALGVQVDAVLSTALDAEDFSWDAIWDSKGRITDSGYVVELAIPFRSLRFPRTTGPQTWGFIASRSYPRGVRHRMRSVPTDRDNSCLLCQASKLTGLEGISPGRNAGLSPTLTSTRTDTRADFPSGAMDPGHLDVDPGLDLRWGITTNLTLNATANPDFSQVEADAAQLDVNERFALFFPEKRPFFLDGADFFATPFNAVFTRTLADPVAGIKLTGKEGAHGLGVLVGRDRITNLLIPSNERSQQVFLEQPATTAAFRYRRDIGDASHFGILYTGRGGPDYGNHVVGADVFYRLSASNRLGLQYLGSVTNYPDSLAAARLEDPSPIVGGGLGIEWEHSSRNWQGGVSYEQLTPDFRADAGFIPRVDTREVEVAALRTFWGSGAGLLTLFAIGAWGNRIYDHNGTLTDQSFGMLGGFEGPSQSWLGLEVGREKRLFEETEHDLTFFTTSFDIRPSGAVVLAIRSRIGDAIDFTNARKAFNVSLSPKVQLNLGRSVFLSLAHHYQRLSAQGIDIFTAHLSQGTLIYHFTAQAFVRMTLQYQDVSRNVGMYVAPTPSETATLLTQFLFSYKLNPQSLLFVGYSDNHLGSDSYGLTQTNRTFFTKLGYAWRP